MQTIGERLEEARKRKGVSIREAAEATKIRSDYLHKFESNQFDINLAEIYVRGFLRSYSFFLKLPADKILNDYAALGRNAPARRQTGREVYGRMDLSGASADDRASDQPSSDGASAPSPAANEPHHRPQNHNRSGNNLPKGPAIPPALIFRGGIALAAIVVLFLVIWGIKAIFSGNDVPVTRTQTDKPPASLAANESSIALVAVNSVRVKVTGKNADGSPGDVIFPETTLNRGEVRNVIRSGPVLIWASEGKNLQIEINGKRYPMPFEGYNRAQIN